MVKNRQFQNWVRYILSHSSKKRIMIVEEGPIIPHQLRGYLINAAISGGVCAVVSASLNGVDVTKIRMQNQNNGISRTANSSIIEEVGKSIGNSQSSIRYSGTL